MSMLSLQTDHLRELAAKTEDRDLYNALHGAAETIETLVMKNESADKVTGHYPDGTLVVEVNDLENVSRVLVEHEPWCKVFYFDQIDCTKCKHYYETEDDTGVRSHCGAMGEKETRMKLVEEAAKTLMNTNGSDIASVAFRNAGRFVQNAIDGEPPEFEKIPTGELRLNSNGYWRCTKCGAIGNKSDNFCRYCGERKKVER